MLHSPHVTSFPPPPTLPHLLPLPGFHTSLTGPLLMTPLAWASSPTPPLPTRAPAVTGTWQALRSPSHPISLAPMNSPFPSIPQQLENPHVPPPPPSSPTDSTCSSPCSRIRLAFPGSHKSPCYKPPPPPASQTPSAPHLSVPLPQGRDSPHASAVQVELHQRAGTLLEGELHRCRMVMRNTGDSSLHNVRLIISHPHVFCPLTNHELQQDPASVLSGRPSVPGTVSLKQLSLCVAGRTHNKMV